MSQSSSDKGPKSRPTAQQIARLNHGVSGSLRVSLAALLLMIGGFSAIYLATSGLINSPAISLPVLAILLLGATLLGNSLPVILPLDGHPGDASTTTKAALLDDPCLKTAGIGVIFYDSDVDGFMVNSLARQHLGVTRTGWISPSILANNLEQSNTTSLWTTIQRAVKEPLLEPQEFVICCGDGHEKYIQIEPAESNREGLELLRIMTRDITHLHHLKRKIQFAETMWDKHHDALVLLDEQFTIIDVNPAFLSLIGSSRASALGQPIQRFRADPEDRKCAASIRSALRRKDNWYGRTWNRTREGEVFLAEERIVKFEPDVGKNARYIALLSDLACRAPEAAAIDRESDTDSLTGLGNREGILAHLRSNLARANVFNRHLAVCYIDLDCYQGVHERFGKTISDELLIAVANRLRSQSRTIDYIARLGGDEFALVLAGVESPEMVMAYGKRLLMSIRGTYQLSNRHKIYLTASIGASFYPSADVSGEVLVRHAHQAMYQAKDKGRDRIELFDAERHRIEDGNRRRLERLRYALENNELCIHLQPLVNMRSGQVLGAEALLRWEHPEDGLVFPDQFLPLVSGTDQAIEVDRWVMEAVMLQIERFSRHGYPLQISVNIDAGYIQSDHFVSDLEALLARHPRVSPALLEIEILESAALTDIERACSIVREVQNMGITVALDDFGTGYSSLTYLKRIPADTLKIDKSFIIDILSSTESRHLVKAIISMACKLHHTVVAEGVETDEHAKMLLDMGCELGQGYGIQKPIAADSLLEWLRAFEQPLLQQESSNVYWLDQAGQK
ncbi:hypothetical protein GCM10007052_18210 [Halioglobus japonicus]|nr:hypothetical protein GCM10007052_18210 [Halioglobus japonicus]